MGNLFGTFGNFTFFERFKKYGPLMTMPLEKYYYSRTATPFTFFNREFDTLYVQGSRDKIEKRFSKKPTDDCFKDITWKNNLNKMLYVDTKTWLPDDLLIKADKITMANSIELRVPLLDHKILEFAAGIPPEYKVKWFTTKYILKQAFMEKVPDEVIQRKKTGFPVPYQRWLKNELRGYVNDILLDPRTLNRGYFDKKTLSKILTGKNGYSVYSKEIFSLLTLELWHRTFFDARQ